MHLLEVPLSGRELGAGIRGNVFHLFSNHLSTNVEKPVGIIGFLLRNLPGSRASPSGKGLQES